MLFVYIAVKSPLIVGVISTLILSEFFIQGVYCTPTRPTNPTDSNNNSIKDDSSSDSKHFNAKIRSHHLLARISAVVTAIFIIFAILTCLCSVHWCATWFRWPNRRGFNWSFESFRLRRRFQLQDIHDEVEEKENNDLPPAYDIVFKTEELSNGNTITATTIKKADNNEDPPPSYTDALMMSSE